MPSEKYYGYKKELERDRARLPDYGHKMVYDSFIESTKKKLASGK